MACPTARYARVPTASANALADKGWKKACADDSNLLNGLNTHKGNLTYAAVGTALNLPVITPEEALSL